jgi:hypothetical protein
MGKPAITTEGWGAGISAIIEQMIYFVKPRRRQRPELVRRGVQARQESRRARPVVFSAATV